MSEELFVFVMIVVKIFPVKQKNRVVHIFEHLFHREATNILKCFFEKT